ncbi:uncharacterized protein BX664DRAFT_323912 [Halteromyces radiatus]|uniref:uncharacterized protein n=1 Tax=Halteromyces radiatus TaxID=101107 RepID=UPI00221FB507|nr:uncharacterized protein BX664DRAFT_323912 [Halteromyces radiatus]KAI8096399.1 hypothetical protein BX664DRAFT_323912 [Halteromyces radiatus]
MVNTEKVLQRIGQSKLTIGYVSLAIVQGVIIIVLETIIAVQNSTQAKATFPYSSLASAFERLTRIKYENVAFIGFQIWAICMVLDATVQQNAAEVCVLAILYVACAILGGLQILDNQRWLEILNSKPIVSTSPLQIALTVEIVLAVCLGLFAISFGLMSYKVTSEFGWMIYKKIGADQAVKHMYTIFQYFVLCMKIDIFVEFLVSVFYLIQFVIKSGEMDWHSWIFLFVTLFMLPMLWLGRTAVARESLSLMILFIVFQAIVVFEFALVLSQTLSDSWYIWTCFVILGILFAVVTSIFGAICMHNFDRGLHPYVQRGSSKRDQRQSSQDQFQMNKQNSTMSWHIDDE